MAVTWPVKDPDAVLDYVYRIALDPGDSISAGNATVTKLSGAVSIDSQSLAGAADTVDGVYGQDVTVWLSGGTDGETAVFKVEWTTVETRTDDDIITLKVVAKEVPALALTGYAKPIPGHLSMRYPAFAGVPASTIQYWLTDAERYVSNAWGEGDYAAGLMALAAHNMAVAGLGTDGAGLASIPAGISSMKSGSLSLNFTPEAANSRLTGSYASTRYGQEYADLLARNRGGPLVAPTGVPPYDYVYPGEWPDGFA